MFALHDPDRTSVTFTDGDPPELQAVRLQLIDPISKLTGRSGFEGWSQQCQKALVTSLNQKRLDKSASNELVRWLLLSAKAGGMSQRQFELSAAELRPNGGRDVGFNGRLWHHYMTTDARMSLATFGEYALYFFQQGWLTTEQHAEARTVVAAGIAMLSSVGGEDRTMRELAQKHPGLIPTGTFLNMIKTFPDPA